MKNKRLPIAITLLVILFSFIKFEIVLPIINDIIIAYVEHTPFIKIVSKFKNGINNITSSEITDIMTPTLKSSLFIFTSLE